MDSATSIAQVLEDASDHILIHGWWNPHVEVVLTENAACISNTIAHSTGYAIAAPHHALFAYLGLHDSGELYAWNDDASRTEDDVHDALKGCAKALRNGELTV